MPENPGNPFKRKRPPNQIWGTGVQHRPDDISIVDRQGLTDTVDRQITDSGDLITPIDPGIFNGLNVARRVRECRQTLTANQALNLAFDSTCVGLEVIVQTVTPAITVGVAFGGDIAQIPSNSNNLVATSEIKSGEARFYDLKTDKISLITAGNNGAVRVTVLLP